MPKTKDTNDFLLRTMKTFDKNQPMWIGMHDKDKEGTIVWEDGSKVLTWGNFEWTNGGLFGVAEDCFALDPYNGKWHDYGCSNTGLLTTLGITPNSKLPFICQYLIKKGQAGSDRGGQGKDNVDD
ncbi:hypothetical protein RRG08_031776 [Elysia crispata]|uniref:C-type lectin domain-containing protein n=1 Tax=Elysia crispata TaxID=231223 RepID=A0AAE1DWB0_9GAST|nr:hypothetical protein RRG08_031776 [Elysia crispata]